jgi:F-type H+-transporting ATPase subunit b
MGTFILLTAEAIEEPGFGLNFDILETNLINLVIIIGVLVYFGRGFLGKTLAERKARIEEAIREAETRKKEAAAALADEQQKLAQAQAEASRILAEAQERAKAVRESVLARAQDDIQRLKAAEAQGLTSQQERVTAELRQRIAALALQQVESQLKSGIGDSTQQQLIDRSIATIGGPS